MTTPDLAHRILRVAPGPLRAAMVATARRLGITLAASRAAEAGAGAEAEAEFHAAARLLHLFDAEWYCAQYPDVAVSGIDPFQHYMDYGWRERRRPAPAFGDEDCAALCPGFRPGTENPVRHLLRQGLNDPALRDRMQAGRRPAPMPHLPSRLQDGLCIVGYLRSEIGLGQAARNLGYACDAARLPVSFRSLSLPGRENDAEFATKCNLVADRRATLLVMGLTGVIPFREEARPGCFNILYPFWELGRFPVEWRAAIADFDEIWAPSEFVASCFGGHAGPPVQRVPQPVRLPRRMPPPRRERTSLRFLTYLDVDSFVARKNPQAAVEAFAAAFPLERRDVELVVKTRGDKDDGLRRWLGEIAARDPRIRVVDRTLDRAAMDALMAECDAFISLHRSEGFGFGAAEALAAGKAVVSTDFSATTDFINASTGYPVTYRLECVRRGEYQHGEGQIWATAEHDAAVAALRAIHDDPAEAEARTRRGFALLQERHSPEAVGRLIGAMLRERGLI